MIVSGGLGVELLVGLRSSTFETTWTFMAHAIFIILSLCFLRHQVLISIFLTNCSFLRELIVKLKNMTGLNDEGYAILIAFFGCLGCGWGPID